MSVNHKRNVPRLFIEKYALNEATDYQKHIVESNLSDRSIKLALDEIEQSNLYVQQNLVMPAALSRANSHSIPQERPKIGFYLGGLAAVALLILTIIPQISDQKPFPDIILKSGEPALQIFRKQGEKVVELHHGDSVAPGDLLELTYSPAGWKYGMIFSVDGSGMFTLHFPSQIDQKGLLAQKQSVKLGFSYELDDAPRHETFIFLSSNQPFSLLEVKESFEMKPHMDQLPENLKILFPEGYNIVRVSLQKGVP
ncbi:hypothetical protein [Pseudobacteriovorax antillogorgiicola]|uniref:DUF4384 domain-containing protein n=1 Tax=Pseudobacteriovorax antillogorgiicola TaxID=1513793 RepID=A0A1Y6CTG3_9BACT|nr:hypothetical protein [Pseudobacteriovorax antillogorgiicola]TCS45671.1 hypothetical protein EDD56_12765 [Pseudobacteriovorax antillogorgiicola]SMF73091.1 hypothetical protein SAMN06296036_12764 [Pseudobacteriovorax antillogorgiicola]